MGVAAAGLRLLLRQAPLRSPSPCRCRRHSRPSWARPRLSGSAGAFPREPRRAARRGGLSLAAAPGGRRCHVPWRPGCGSSIKASWRARRSECRCTCAAHRPKPATPILPPSTTGSWPALRTSDAFRNGAWSLIPPQSAWAGNPTWQDFISYAWQSPDGGRYVVVVNYSDHQGQCRLAAALRRFGWPAISADRCDGKRGLFAGRRRPARSRASTSISGRGATMSSGWSPSGLDQGT